MQTNFSIIQKSQLEGAERLDAEYYQPEYLNYKKNLQKMDAVELVQLANNIDVGFVSSMTNHFQDSGIPLLRTQNVQELNLNLDNNIVYIDEDFHNRLKKSQIKPGQVLLARSGSIGNSAVVPENFPTANSADIILIETKTDLLPEFLAAFLNSKYGKFQVERATSGGLQGHINLFSLEQLLVPKFGISQQDKIKKIVEKTFQETKESKKFYQQAEDLLLKELGLKDFQAEDDLNYVVNFSEVKDADRIDAEYFQPKYEKIINSLGQNRQRLKNIAVRKAKKEVITKENDYKYIEISDINVGNGEISFNSVRGSELPANAKLKIEGGELLISKVRPTRGAIAIVPEDWNKNFIASGAFSVFETELVPKEYLQVILKSIIGKLQFEKPTTGTSYPTITDEDVESLQIPVLSKGKQKEIAELVRKSHEARKKSKELLAEAKRKVEEMIDSASSL